MSRPSTHTVPEVGRSRPPRICKSVVLPEPEAPTIAILCPAATASVTPRSTCSVSGPWRKLLQTSTATNTESVMSQRLRRCRARSAPRRVQRREHTEQKGYGTYPQHVEPLDIRRQLAHEIHARVQKLRMQRVLQSANERLQIVRHENPERRTAERPGKTNQYALYGKNREYVARTRAQRAQNRDVGLLLLHDHDQRRDDIEGGDRHEHQENDEQH